MTASLSAAERDIVLAAIEALSALDTSRTYNRAAQFKPYKKQLEHFKHGKGKRERLFMAGNQLGKSDAGALETAYHLTGDYPDWWPGRRWTRPVDGWAAGETALVTRDVQQKKLCGTPGVVTKFGTGLIPKDRFADKPSMSRSATDAFDTIQVVHKSGGISTLKFKSYEQGRAKFQGDTVDFIWLDEEPKMEVYQEALTRTTATRGMIFMTFTPLKGRSEVVLRFLDEPSPDRATTYMTIDDVAGEAHGHITPEDRDTITAGYLPHQRDARTMGIPLLGSGKVFTTALEDILEDQIEDIPAHWAKLVHIDFGINHPFAWLLGLFDRDLDVIHIHAGQRMTGEIPVMHARNIKFIAAEVPVAWPHDGDQREKGTGIPLQRLYKVEGLKMLDKPSCWEDGGNSVETGIVEMDQRFKSGRLKFARHLGDLIQEYMNYHRKDGLIVKVEDDLMDCARGIVMMRRFARVVALGSQQKKRRRSEVADGIDFDVFA